jgi:hypothetical protein
MTELSHGDCKFNMLIDPFCFKTFATIYSNSIAYDFNWLYVSLIIIISPPNTSTCKNCNSDVTFYVIITARYKYELQYSDENVMKDIFGLGRLRESFYTEKIWGRKVGIICWENSRPYLSILVKKSALIMMKSKKLM